MFSWSVVFCRFAWMCICSVSLHRVYNYYLYKYILCLPMWTSYCMLCSVFAFVRCAFFTWILLGLKTKDINKSDEKRKTLTLSPIEHNFLHISFALNCPLWEKYNFRPLSGDAVAWLLKHYAAVTRVSSSIRAVTCTNLYFPLSFSNIKLPQLSKIISAYR